MRFALVDQAKKEFPVHRLCQVLGVSQSGYFAWKDRPASRRQRYDMVMLAHFRSAFALSNGTYGSPRMTRELQDDGFAIGRRRTARLMRGTACVAGRSGGSNARPTASIAGRSPRTSSTRTSRQQPNQKWGVDISYVWTREGWLYLAVVIDLFSRRVVGWAVGDRLHRDLALAALRKALVMRRPVRGADPSFRPRQLILLCGLLGRNCAATASASLCQAREIAMTTPWSRRSSRRSSPSSSGAPSSTHAPRPGGPLPKPAPGHKVYPYLLRKLAVTRPNQVWATDITYVPMARGFVYLVAIGDWFTRRVLAWRVSISLDAGFCIEALEEALARHGKPAIFNSDQGGACQEGSDDAKHRWKAGGGSQFTSTAFTAV